MSDVAKTKEELIRELTEIREQFSRLHVSAVGETKVNYGAVTPVRSDDLTKLVDRSVLADRFGPIISRDRHGKAGEERHLAAFFCIDVDRFKMINEALGHAEGDELIKGVTERFLKVLRDTDTVARTGGNEFIILVPDIRGLTDIIQLCNRFFSLFRTPFKLKEEEVCITISIGVSVYPDDGMEIESLIKHAGIAMNRAKQEGYNNFMLYTSSMGEDAMAQLTLTSKLRKAVENDEFTLHYQPLIDMATGDVSGMEALIRWRDKDGGLVYPSEFIPLAEDTGLIVPMGEWVLREASFQQKKWCAAGLKPVKIAVNISTRQFKEQSFLTKVEHIVRETGLDPQAFVLELTESIILDDAKSTMTILHSLKEMGFILSIDDFGTGYSSLAYLKKMPIDILKIDRSFIRDITSNSDDKAISSAIINIAHSLELDVVAEGVESKAQYELLKSLRCNKMQGFVVAKPLPPEECEQYLTDHWRYKN